MRTLLALTLLALADPVAAQDLQIPLSTGQIWVHQGRLRSQMVGQDESFHVTQVTCIGRALSGERFLIGGMVDVRPALLSNDGSGQSTARFTGVVQGRDGVSEFAASALGRGEHMVPLVWSPQAAFPPMPVEDSWTGAEPNTRFATLWWGLAPEMCRVRITDDGEVELDRLPCLLWHMNYQGEREIGMEGHRHGHTRISLWWDAATAMPARVQTYLLGSAPGRPLFQETLTLDMRRLVTTTDGAAITAFEHLTDDPPPDPVAFERLAEDLTDPEVKRLVRMLAEALR